MTTTSPPEDALALTDAEVAAIVPDARKAHADAARVLAEAEADPTSVTPAKLAELRAAVDHTALCVPVAERRHAAIHAARSDVRREQIREQIRAEAASDLDGAEQIIAAFDAYEAAVRGVCEAVTAHNGRITKWSRLMGTAGIQPIHGEGRGEDALAHMIGGDSVTVGQKVYRRMRGGTFLAVVLARVLEAYPRDFRKFNVDMELGVGGDLVDTNGRVDVHALIRRDA
ncbi:hypothetical protein [Streptomyces scabiei]|uniref:hypothetical protein n=1 Tax=Streptomyces scabiei TaxID=1930 RepID=UPI001B325D26|nr:MULTISPECIES: hypothetical protein [Streptomyces]MBP5892808.1 hypothetical protein [Streptomyces sp. LBUM 1481]MBP5923074.1 hypothetical protein [Streptomyces sp. LBUM 1483]MDX2686872.1 hypothetical protein [Streptomyces scabiei]MDX2753082.1 hypothetical protein [Streptomyces scabiei]MDX2807271.1 hypothetical protein [Streptomyces scabiei]